MTEPAVTGSSQWGWWVAVVFGLQILFFWAGSGAVQNNTDSPPPLRLKNIEGNNLLGRLALEDPVALSRPNKHGFSGVWLRPALVEHQLARWVPPDMPLPGQSNLVKDLITQTLEENASPDMRLFVKPAPTISRVTVPPLRMENSSWLSVEGALGMRALIKPVSLVSDWEVESLLHASHVQVVVDLQGQVLSGVLLKSSGHKPADAAALDISLRKIAFEKSSSSKNFLEIGDLLFHWHVNPSFITNIVERIP